MGKQHKRLMQVFTAGGTITRAEAMQELGIGNLPARISELRAEGHDITCEMVEGRNRFKEKIEYGKYFMTCYRPSPVPKVQPDLFNINRQKANTW